MLKNISVFVCNCYAHDILSFRHAAFFDKAVPVGAAVVAAVAKAHVASLYAKGSCLHQRLGYFAPGGDIDFLHGGAGHLHPDAAFLLGKALPVNEPYGLVFVHAQYDLVSPDLRRREKQILGQKAKLPAFCGSRHEFRPP